MLFPMFDLSDEMYKSAVNIYTCLIWLFIAFSMVVSKVEYLSIKIIIFSGSRMITMAEILGPKQKHSMGMFKDVDFCRNAVRKNKRQLAWIATQSEYDRNLVMLKER